MLDDRDLPTADPAVAESAHIAAVQPSRTATRNRGYAIGEAGRRGLDQDPATLR